MGSLPVELHHGLRACTCAIPHRGRFDRLRAAQAELEAPTVSKEVRSLSSDPALRAFPGRRLRQAALDPRPWPRFSTPG